MQFPAEPHQTKYPVLYPALLSLIWRADARFPQNIVLVRWLNVTLWTVGSWFAYRLMRDAWRLPRPLALLAVVLGFVSFATLGVLGTAMSEPLYVALSMPALWLAAQSAAPRSAAKPDAPAPRVCRTGLWHIALLALLLGGAVLTRSVAIALVGGLLLALLLKRRWGLTLAALGGFLCAAAGWQAWRTWAAARNACNPLNAALVYDLDYSAWLASWTTHLWVAWVNAPDLLLSLALILVPVNEGALVGLLQRVPVGTALVLVPAGLIAGVMLLGTLVTWRRGGAAAHLYAAAYLALILPWPFEPLRFLVVLAPLLFGWLLAGLYVALATLLGGWPKHRSAGDAPRLARFGRREGHATARVLTTFVGAGLALLALGPFTLGARDVKRKFEHMIAQQEAIVALLRDHTPPDAIVSNAHYSYLYLRTGRKCVPQLPTDGATQIRTSYGPERPVWACGRGEWAGRFRTIELFTRARLLDFLRESGATHVVPLRTLDRLPYANAFAQLQELHPGWFLPVARSPLQTDGSAPFELYRVLAP
ncbi:MAG: hypothetical protein PVJ57_08830 [Phycisphaerae bacterium]|jgi:hypothetical protein